MRLYWVFCMRIHVHKQAKECTEKVNEFVSPLTAFANAIDGATKFCVSALESSILLLCRMSCPREWLQDLRPWV